MQYKAIGFDWGGVINGAPATEFVRKMGELLGVTPQEYLDAYYAHNKAVNRGEISWPELWQLVAKDLGQTEKVPQMLALDAEFHTVSTNQNILNLVDGLRAQGYAVGLLSNNTLERAEVMRADGLDSHFDVFHISAETGLVKPEPQAFASFAEALGVTMQELVFVDDSEKSLSTAPQCGYAPILYTSFLQLCNSLKQLGISW